MSEVLINGMEMPKTAGYCSKKIDPDTRRCIYTGKEFEETLSLLLNRRCADCPLVEVQTPHGRLIDEDALKEQIKTGLGIKSFKHLLPIERYIMEQINHMPTIIESEGSEE